MDSGSNLLLFTLPGAVMNDRTDDQALQAMDEERQFFRCLELAEMAERRGFTGDDLKDLRYHLGVSNHYERRT